MTTSTTNSPVKRFRSGSVSASVWRNDPDAGGTYFSVTFSRGYKRGDDWQDTQSFGARDLIDLRRVLASAEQFIADQPA